MHRDGLSRLELGQVRVGPGPLQFQRDSLTTKVALRR